MDYTKIVNILDQRIRNAVSGFKIGDPQLLMVVRIVLNQAIIDGLISGFKDIEIDNPTDFTVYLPVSTCNINVSANFTRDGFLQ